MTDNTKAPERTSKGQFRTRISAEARAAVTIMATEGVSRAEAAERADITDDALRRALKRPHVRRLFNQIVKEVRDNAAQAAYLKINHLSDTADNERLKYDANRWIAGVDGISPVQKVQGTHSHRHEFGGFVFDDSDVIDGTATDSQSGVVEAQPIDMDD